MGLFHSKHEENESSHEGVDDKHLVNESSHVDDKHLVKELDTYISTFAEVHGSNVISSDINKEVDIKVEAEVSYVEKRGEPCARSEEATATVAEEVDDTEKEYYLDIAREISEDTTTDTLDIAIDGRKISMNEEADNDDIEDPELTRHYINILDDTDSDNEIKVGDAYEHSPTYDEKTTNRTTNILDNNNAYNYTPDDADTYTFAPESEVAYDFPLIDHNVLQDTAMNAMNYYTTLKNTGSVVYDQGTAVSNTAAFEGSSRKRKNTSATTDGVGYDQDFPRYERDQNIEYEDGGTWEMCKKKKKKKHKHKHKHREKDYEDY